MRKSSSLSSNFNIHRKYWYQILDTNQQITKLDIIKQITKLDIIKKKLKLQTSVRTVKGLLKQNTTYSFNNRF